MKYSTMVAATVGNATHFTEANREVVANVMAGMMALSVDASASVHKKAAGF